MPPDPQKLAPSKGFCEETGLNLHWGVLAGGYKAGVSPYSFKQAYFLPTLLVHAGPCDAEQGYRG